VERAVLEAIRAVRDDQRADETRHVHRRLRRGVSKSKSRKSLIYRPTHHHELNIASGVAYHEQNLTISTAQQT
jgi:hypothetical protein